MKVYGFTIINSEGYVNGNESKTKLFNNKLDCSFEAYISYLEIINQIKDELEESFEEMSGLEFKETLVDRKENVCIQCYDYHIQFEWIEQEV